MISKKIDKDTTIKVLIVEDEPIIAEDIASILNNLNFSVAGIAYNISQALDLLAVRNLDIALLDINLQNPMDGIEIAKIINEKYKIPFLYLTSHTDSNTLDLAKVTFPYGYIVKPFDERDLLSSLEMAIYRHANEIKELFPSLETINSKIFTPISNKEYDVLEDIYKGLTNKQMADKHFVSINTVKTHIKNIYSKFDVHSRTEVIHWLQNC